MHIVSNAVKMMPNTIVQVPLTLEQMFHGYNFTHKAQINRFCKTCLGHSGAHSHDDITPCPVCQGTGRHLYIRDGEAGFVHAVNTTCKSCDGYGNLINKKCTMCGGYHTILEEVSFEISLPPGTFPSQSITRPQEGNCKFGYQCGDVVFLVTQDARRHSTFTLEGVVVDVYM